MSSTCVGYPANENGFKFYNSNTKKTLRSRDVIFVENEFDIESCTNLEKNYEFFTNNFMDDVTESEDDEVQDGALPVDVEHHTRPVRARRPPDRHDMLTGEWWNFIENASVATADAEKPTTIDETLNGANSKQWLMATQSEFNSLKQNQTWDLIDLPPGKNIIGSKWTFKHKRGPDGEINTYKVRLIAQGFLQQHGVDYNEVFAPVAKYSSIRSLLFIANQLNLEIHQMDVKTAFLNGELEEEIFIKQRESFIDKDRPDMV